MAKLPAVLKNTQFLKLWGNQILLQVAFNMSNYTAILILADRTHSPFIQAQFYAALTIPAFIFGLIAGPIVDITDRKNLMLITDILLALLFFGYAFVGGAVVPILLIAFLTSSVARFFIPAEAATIPLVVSEEALEGANTFFLFTLLGSVLVGYAIAGPMIQMFGGLHTKGEVVPFVVSGFMLITGLILRLTLKKIPHTLPSLPERNIFLNTIHLFYETAQEVGQNHKISLPLALLVFVELMNGMLSVVLLEYVRRYLELPLTSVSYVLMLPLIAGLVAGTAFLGNVERKFGHRKSIFLATVTLGFVLMLFGAVPVFHSILISRVVAVSGAFVLGIQVVFIAVQSRTILQRNAKSEMHGRIFSFLDVMIAFATPVPVLLLGFFADRVSLLATLITIGLGIIFVSLIGKRVVLQGRGV
ncbi:MAG TPA: MFS transporter [Candidatus Saccharimonadales bacterium]|nr:MFS transporter [Candidatus Saccharimonadales bacterium]